MPYDLSDETVQFKMCADSGGAWESPEFPYPIVHDLATLVIPDQVRVKFRHDTVLGVASARVHKGRRLVSWGVIGRGGDDYLTANIASYAQRGELMQASASTRCSILTFYDEGESVHVNRRTFHGPILVAREARLVELSATFDGEAGDPRSWFVVNVEGSHEFTLAAGFPSRKRLLDDLIKCQRAERDLAIHTANIKAQWAAEAADRQYENEQRWLVESRREASEKFQRSLDTHDRIIAASQPRRQSEEPIKNVITEITERNEQAQQDRRKKTFDFVRARQPRSSGWDEDLARYAEDLERAGLGRG